MSRNTSGRVQHMLFYKKGLTKGSFEDTLSVNSCNDSSLDTDPALDIIKESDVEYSPRALASTME